MNEANQRTVNVVVHFPAAPEPFKDHNADPTETLAQLKARVLSAFGLKEGQGNDGSVTTYTFYNQKTPLEDLSVTLGDLAGGKHELQLKLAQQVTQG